MDSDEPGVDEPSIPSTPAEWTNWTDWPEPSAPVPAPRRSSAARWIAIVLVVALIAAGAVFVVTRSGDDDDAPSAWDPRIAELADFVEHERGLAFDHPIQSEFLSEDEFRKKVTNNEELTEEDKDEIRHYEGLFRALGLVEGNLDLVQSMNQLAGETVLGLYDPETKTVFIRGNTITPDMRPTIVHELTHALQDQHFDLSRELHPSGEDSAYRALFEADALRIEDKYEATLTQEERDAIDAAEDTLRQEADLEGVPKVLTELFAMPYVLGPPFVDAVVRERGDKGVDRAFKERPTSEEQIANPAAYFIGDNPSKVPTPKLRSGEKKVGDADDFGMVSLLLVLGERLSFPQAWTAVDGWKGDASVGYRADGRDCIRDRTELDSPVDADELEAALRAWGEGHNTTTTRTGRRTVEFSSCDPGADAPSTAIAGRPRTFSLLALRTQLVSALAEEGLPASAAECVADDVLRTHDAAKLLELDTISDQNDPRVTAIQRDVAASVQRCTK
jgi:hypothetical protein